MKKKIFNPKISIIMVIHNEESAIIKSVKSILNQNFDKFELLILGEFFSLTLKKVKKLFFGPSK